MDIVTMALNLFSRGVDPELDLSDVDAVREMYTRCTRMEVHPRHPYAGELVYTAFSGSHQDAISKGMKAFSAGDGKTWEVPYLPIDPADVGRTYESIIRINSQSGKGGAAYVLEKEFGIQLPKWFQPDFGAAVQKVADATGAELSAQELRACFLKEYIEPVAPWKLERCHIDIDEGDADGARVLAVVSVNGKESVFEERGNGPVDAFVRGLQKNGAGVFTLEQYAEHAVTRGADALAVACIGIRGTDGRAAFGAGIDPDIGIASLRAVLSALNRL